MIGGEVEVIMARETSKIECFGGRSDRPELATREFIDQLCCRDCGGISPDRLSDVLRMLDRLNGTSS